MPWMYYAQSLSKSVWNEDWPALNVVSLHKSLEVRETMAISASGASWRKNSWGGEGEMELLFARNVLNRKPPPKKNKSCSQRKPAILTENNGDLVDLIVKDTENISLFLLEPCWSSLPVMPLCVCRWLGSLSFHTEVPVAWRNPITLFPWVPLVAKVSIWNRTEVMGRGRRRVQFETEALSQLGFLSDEK